MKIQCPRCRLAITGENVNMSTDLAYCPNCEESFRISEAVGIRGTSTGVSRDDGELTVPSGAWFYETPTGFSLGASTRSPIAFFLVPFMLVWSGGSLGGIYGVQIVTKEFNLLMSLFGLPFLVGSLFLVSATLMFVFGKVEIVVGQEDYVFTGVGRLGYRRRFDWQEVTAVREELVLNSRFSSSSSSRSGILMEGASRLKLGIFLNARRRYFVVRKLNELLARRR